MCQGTQPQKSESEIKDGRRVYGSRQGEREGCVKAKRLQEVRNKQTQGAGEGEVD